MEFLLLLLLGLPLWVTVCSVSNLNQCEIDEFEIENLCCQRCPAGTHYISQCQKNHGESECAPCEPEHFMNNKNHESDCFRCSLCREDQEEVAECTQVADRVCQCKNGTYCNSENCVEMCRTCSSCPNGRVLRQCNATLDTVCVTFDSEPGILDYQCSCFPEALCIIVVIAAVIILIAAVIAIICAIIRAIIWCFHKRDRVSLCSGPGCPGLGLQTSLASNSQGSTCLCLSSAGIKSMCYDARQLQTAVNCRVDAGI